MDYYKLSLFELEGGNGGDHSYRRSLQYITKALSQEVNPCYLAHKATLLFLVGNQEESMEYFNRALSLSMSSSVRAEILNNYACLLARSGKKEEALRLFMQLENDKAYLTPEVVLVNQAKIYYDSGNFEVAKRKLMHAAVVAGDYVDAHYYLALTWHRLQDQENCLKSIERTLALEPEHEGACELLERLRGRSSS